MQFSIVWVAFAIVTGFVFGFAISFLADKALMSKWRKDAVFAQFCVTMLEGACRDVLSDAFYKRVMKAYRSKVEVRCAR